MHILISPDGSLEMTPDHNDMLDFKEAHRRDPNLIEGFAYDTLSGMLIDPMGNGVEYEVAAPEEFRRGGGFAITNNETAWYYPEEDLFTRLTQGDTILWQQL
jgi:hypothetical protein